MDKRNQISIAIISCIIIVGSLATPLTIRDYDTIIDDFINSPIFPPPILHEGTLNLYYTCDYSEENSPIMDFIELSLNAANETENITGIWISITEITLLGQKAGNSKFFTSDDVFDILVAQDNHTLLKSGNLTAAEYAGVQLHFNSTITIQIGSDTFYAFSIQGNNIITVPFNIFNQANSSADLDIVEDTINDVLLDFNLEILWQNSTARILTKAYIM